jgi:regulator of protease activity HflC (stomatin/prohibitin superfamily)
VDRIAYRIDMRERAMAIAPQSAITKDNVSVDVSGILYIQVPTYTYISGAHRLTERLEG